MDLERYDHSGVDIYCKHIRGDHWGASSDCLDKGITVARGKQFKECARIDDRDSRGEVPDMT